ncbi:DNA recombination protein RmuC [Pokkaliibacter plantistimulans]|uniref:DNA recombination protein RmuC n=1 Tax=Proteobacteria bacterium 228 TaxID=2083153 RepID=A0A2S5KS89_9PROT|nr:DNA recombination protein RmuC [Pokkaliibacter plantistimulans]PPC77389.1 DNA recombination protein RmuC [Pokkaliibacter plantistimulans]
MPILQGSFPVGLILLGLGIFLAGWLVASAIARRQFVLQRNAWEQQWQTASERFQEDQHRSQQQLSEFREERQALQLSLERHRQELRDKGERLIALQSDRQRLGDRLDELRERFDDAEVQLREVQEEKHRADTELAQSCERLLHFQQTQQELTELRQHHEQRLQQLTDAEATIRELNTRMTAEQRQHEEKLALLQRAEEQLKQQFENLAQRIFHSSAERFTQQNKSQLDGLIAPLKEQLGEFKRQVQDTYEKEAFERRTLRHEIGTLKELNQRMSEEALNLTRALKGDKKLQGNWGEMILSRVLSESGLREGHEYHTQVALKSVDGKGYQPDVIVHLPDEKDIIIDAKVSLVDYETYHSSEDELIRQEALRRHCQALRNHIRGLGAKDYQNLKGIRTLDYVLMFIPIEAAFLTAIEHDPELFQFGLENNILLVSPTNLLVVLRTINHIWQYEKQNRNAQIIAAQAADLYDKLRGFAEDMLRLGQELNQSQAAYQKAMNKFSEGRGNLVSRAQRFVELGAKPSKLMPVELLDMAEMQFDDDAEVTPTGITEQEAGSDLN